MLLAPLHDSALTAADIKVYCADVNTGYFAMNNVNTEILTRHRLSRVQRLMCAAVALALCLVILARYQIINDFSILPGDRYDSVISATILEHWYRVFLGRDNWSQVNYFYPYTRTIAQTDAYFLIGVAYFPFRLMGLDPFVSSFFATSGIKAVGFVGVYLLSRKALSLPFRWALLAATLFTLSNGMTVHSSRSQLATVAFAPVLAVFLWLTVRGFIENRSKRILKYGIASGVFFGAWCLTCFYMAWFFAFFMTIFLITALIYQGRTGLSTIKRQLARHYASALVVVITAAISLLPFVYAFLPKSREVGVRSFSSVFSYTIPIEQILQVGTENFLYGRLYNAALQYVDPAYTPQGGEYYNTGFSLILFILFVFGCVRIFRQARQGTIGMILPCITITTLVTWMLALRINGHSAWYFVYAVFPGAQALNVVSTYQILLALPVVVIVANYLSSRRVSMPAMFFLSLILIAGEINTPYDNMTRSRELERISLPNAPPSDCKVFYASGWKDGGTPENRINDLYAHNVSAMLIAEIVGIPTVNGFASFNPPDWNFASPNKPDYDNRVRSYATKHQIAGMCRLDLNTKQWSIVGN
jgi:hypothetical protein